MSVVIRNVTAVNWEGDVTELSLQDLNARRTALALAIANAMHRFGVDPAHLSRPGRARFGVGEWPGSERAPLLQLYGEVSDELDRRGTGGSGTANQDR